jgi:hypothetical protein
MATTEERLVTADELRELYEKSPDPVESVVVDEQPARPRTVITVSDFGARLLLGAWITVLAVIFIFEPTPANANAPVPLWADLAAIAFLLSFIATFSGLSMRRPWGAAGSLMAAGFGSVLAIACAATGHHIGAWWAYELVGFGALGALTVGAVKRA